MNILTDDSSSSDHTLAPVLSPEVQSIIVIADRDRQNLDATIPQPEHKTGLMGIISAAGYRHHLMAEHLLLGAIDSGSPFVTALFAGIDLAPARRELIEYIETHGIVDDGVQGAANREAAADLFFNIGRKLHLHVDDQQKSFHEKTDSHLKELATAVHYAPSAHRTLEEATAQAVNNGKNQISIADLFVALLSGNNSCAAKVLAELEITNEKITSIPI